MKLRKPAALRPGDRIAVVSPAGPIDQKRLTAGIKRLQQWGYDPIVAPHAAGQHAYLSAPDNDRLDDLTQAFTDPAIQAVFCSRGGYGSGRLLADIFYHVIAEHPKLFVGFSDTTALNWAFLHKGGLVSLSGPTVGEIGDGLPAQAEKSFREMLNGSEPTAVELQPLRSGTAEGPLLPGCLSIITTLLGTPYCPDLTGTILVIEDVGEKPYRIDRMLTHLKNAGVFDRIAALVVGRMIDCWPKTRHSQHLPLEEILLDLTAPSGIPLYTGLPYGHHPERLTLPVGIPAAIEANHTLRLLEIPISKA